MTAEAPVTGHIGLNRAVRDAGILTRRNLFKYVRVPTLLLFSTVQPIMFVLLFAFVFGGAIAGPDGNYINFLLPGIMVQTALFGSTNTGIGLADDMSKGIIDRFRSLPMARSAVLMGRTLSDGIRNTFVVLLIVAVGYVIGFRFNAGFVKAVAAIALASLISYAFSWISANIGLSLKEVETVQAAGFIWIFPLTFASSVFVPVETMPSWLQGFATINPVTVTADALRALVEGGPLQPALGQSLLWIVGILVVFIPLGVRNYRKAV